MIKNNYWVWDNAIPKSFCNDIISTTNWDTAEEATIGTGVGNECVVDTKKRKSSIVWAPQLSLIWCVCNSFILEANARAEWNYYLGYLEQIQLTKYASDEYYDWHVDTANPDENDIQRKLSVSILLNDPNEYEGGNFEFENCSIDLKQGSVLVFPSFLKHRVAPVTSGIRYSAVSWMHGPAFK